MTPYVFHVDAPRVADAGSETDIQSRFISRLRAVAPLVFVAAVPNGMKTTAWGAMNAKREGLVSGFPDLICTWLRSCAFIEFKARTGSLSEAQVRVLTRLHNQGHHVGVFRSVDNAIEFIREAGAPFAAELGRAA